MLNVFQMKVLSSTATGVGAQITNPNYCCDGNPTTDCVLSVGGPSATCTLILQPVIGLVRRYSSVTLNVLLSCPTNSLTGLDGATISYSLDGSTYTTLLTIAAGVTKPLQTLTASLPLSGNLSQATVKIVLTAGSADVGVGVVDLFEAWIDAVE
jgi:hypothetical protein